MSKAIRNFWITITLLFVVTLAWMTVSRVDITTQAVGVTVPENDNTEIMAMIAGEVTEVHTSEGARVSKGDVLITVSPGVGYEDRDIVSTIDGTIQRLNFMNSGGFVKRGDPVALIIPADNECVVEAKLLVKDRGYVQLGDAVKVKLANQDQMRYDAIDGEVISISPDVVQSREGTYYEVRIRLSKQQFTGTAKRFDLVAGIQVQNFIVTGSRSILEYVLQPFSGIGQALQER
jgi:multidrug efflux pump subunit AcrA (membrane-fusion protein)